MEKAALAKGEGPGRVANALPGAKSTFCSRQRSKITGAESETPDGERSNPTNNTRVSMGGESQRVAVAISQKNIPADGADHDAKPVRCFSAHFCMKDRRSA